MTCDLRINDRKTFWILLLVLTLWKVLLAWKLDVCYDEGYYFFWSLHPQLSYLDHPPLVAWAMALSRWLFGDSIWTVRCWPLAAGTLFPLVGRALAKEMFDEETGNRSGIFLMICPSFAGTGFLMTPDTLFAMFWTITLVFTWKALGNSARSLSWWALAGLFVGMGLLSKYNMVLYFLGLGFFFIMTPDKRRNIFFGALFGGIVALIVFIPVLVWNLKNDWISFRFQLHHGFSTDGYTLWETFPGYIGGLLLVATPLLGGLTFWSSAKGIVSGDERRQFLGAFFWAFVVFFAISAFKGKVSANWPMLAFFSGVILVAADWDFYGKKLRCATVSLLVFVMLFGLIYFSLPAGFGLAIGGRSLDIIRMREFIGGKECASMVRKKREELHLDFICISRHQLLGEIAFYAPDLRPLLWLRKGGPDRFPWIDHKKWKGKSALLVSHKPRSWHMFRKVEPLGHVEISYKKTLKRTLCLYKGIGYMP